MKDIFDALHSKLSESSNSNRVKSMLAQITALLGRVGYLQGDDKGRDFLEFIVRLCALPAQPGDEVRKDWFILYCCKRLAKCIP
jgi:hypothetical protein